MEREYSRVHGLRFELDYSSLRSTDFVWLFGNLRAETVKVLIEKYEVPSQQLVGARLPFEVAEVQAKRSIVLDIFPLIGHEAWAWDMIAGVVTILFVELFRQWLSRRERQRGYLSPFGKGRPNLHRVTSHRISREFNPETGTFRETVVDSIEESIEWRSRRSR